jgi:hypothetical protein
MFGPRPVGLLVCVAATLLAIAPGCGPDIKARGVVRGKVTANKTPLNSGTVTFHGANNTIGTSNIDLEGNYEITDAPVGDVTITVFVPAPPPGPKGMTKKWDKIMGPGSKDPTGETPGMMIGKFADNPVRIDDKYSQPETSGLKFTVQKGEQVHNIEL